MTQQPKHTRPDTALGEVEKDIEEAETQVPEREEETGEGADAITPNVGAQEQSQSEDA